MPIVVEGIGELKRALKKFAPDLRAEMDREITAELKMVRDAARAKVPSGVPGGLYNWWDNGRDPVSRTSKSDAFPLYNPTIIRKGLVYRTGTSKRNPDGFAALFSLLNSSRTGAILETSGRKNPSGRPQMGNHGSKSTQTFGRSNNPDAGRRFVSAMQDVGSLKAYDSHARSRGRLLYSVYADRQGKTLDAVFKAIYKAKTKFDAMSKANVKAAA